MIPLFNSGGGSGGGCGGTGGSGDGGGDGGGGSGGVGGGGGGGGGASANIREMCVHVSPISYFSAWPFLPVVGFPLT